jgi:GNAT superfamily N-acetyltransferase
MPDEIIYHAVTNPSDDIHRPLYEWWAEKTRPDAKSYLVPRTPEFYINNLVYATVAYSGGSVVGVGGIIQCFDRAKNLIFYQDRPVVEFCSVYVDPVFRGQHISKQLIINRMDFSKEKNFLAVIVTREQNIISTIPNLGWKDMKELEQYHDLWESLRDCTCEGAHKATFIGQRCNVCPLTDRSIFVLE